MKKQIFILIFALLAATSAFAYTPNHHVVAGRETNFVIRSADGTFIHGSVEAGQNVSTGQEIMEIIDDDQNYYDRLLEFAVPFQAGQAVKPDGFPILHNGKLYRVVQGHTTQADWTPDIVPALFVEIPAPVPGTDYPEWKQPAGAHDAYNIGDRVVFDGKVYESKINANVWSPAVYPAGWLLIP